MPVEAKQISSALLLASLLIKELTAVDQYRELPLLELLVQPLPLVDLNALMHEAGIDPLLAKGVGEGDDVGDGDAEDES